MDEGEPEPDRFLVGTLACIAESGELAQSLLEAALGYRVNVLSGTFDAQKRELAKS